MATNQPPGYPPPGGGYPPQGGPPPGGGYPPQGGYPPPGYPPQGYGPPAGFVPQQSRPGTITGACVLWIIYGSLGLIGGLLSLAASGGRVGAPGIVPLMISAAFLISGIQVLMGKARTVLASGISSIVWGAVQLILLLALGSLFRGFGGAGSIIVVFGLIVGGILITAGILAIVGNAKYKAWRMTRGL